ncbi:MAG TPA: type II secretion system F family protein [Isosphaeraceae bacterium]|jgi:tight adherence protein C
MTPDLIAATTFLAIVLLSLGLAAALLGRRPAREAKDIRLPAASLWDHSDPGDRPGFGSDPRGAWVGLLAGLIPQMGVEARRLDRELGHAGYYRRTARVEFLALRNGLVLAVLIVAGLMAAAGAERGEWAARILAAGLVAALLAYGAPRLGVQAAGRARLLRIQRALPDALDLIGLGMTGGLSFPEALERVARDLVPAQPDLAAELRIVRRHCELGCLEQAFRQWAARLDLPELKSMTALVVQAERLGTGLVAPLDVFAGDLRGARRQRADARASSAVVRIMPPMILCLLPATMLLMWGPALLELRDFWRREHAPGGALAVPGDLGGPGTPAPVLVPGPAAFDPLGPRAVR